MTTANHPPLTDAELDAIAARADACAPPPWRVGDEIGGHVSEVVAPCECCGRIAVCDQFGPSETRDCYHSEFIAHARADVPRLVEMARERNRLTGLGTIADGKGLLSSECPNCGRLHERADFHAKPGPVQIDRNRLIADRDRLAARVTELTAEVAVLREQVTHLKTGGIVHWPQPAPGEWRAN